MENDPNKTPNETPETPNTGSGSAPSTTPASNVPPAQSGTSTTVYNSNNDAQPPQSPEPEPQTTQEVPPSGSGRKQMGMMVGALVVLLLVFLGLIYFFVLRNPNEPQQPVQQLPVQDLPVDETSEEAVTPTPELTEDAVDDIDIGSPEAELSPIQEDLEQL